MATCNEGQEGPDCRLIFDQAVCRKVIDDALGHHNYKTGAGGLLATNATSRQHYYYLVSSDAEEICIRTFHRQKYLIWKCSESRPQQR